MKTMQTTINKFKSAMLSFALFCTPFLSLATNFNRGYEPDSTYCLEVSGKIEGMNPNVKGTITICLIKDNEQITCTEVKPGKVFTFKLLRNAYYTIKIWKMDYITRSVSIDTHLPQMVANEPIFRFHFDTQLVKKTAFNQANDDYEFPVAIISYHTDKGWFDYSKKYTALVKEQIIATKSQVTNK